LASFVSDRLEHATDGPQQPLAFKGSGNRYFHPNTVPQPATRFARRRGRAPVKGAFDCRTFHFSIGWDRCRRNRHQERFPARPWR